MHILEINFPKISYADTIELQILTFKSCASVFSNSKFSAGGPKISTKRRKTHGDKWLNYVSLSYYMTDF